MDFFQVLGVVGVFIGIISGIVTIAGYFFSNVNATKYKLLLTGIPLAFILIISGVAVLIVPPIATNTHQLNNQEPTVTTISQRPTTQAQTVTPRNTPTLTQSPTFQPQSEPQYQEDWSKGLDGWQGDSEWQVLGNHLLVSNGSTTSYYGALISPYQPNTPNYVVEAQIQYVGWGESMHCYNSNEPFFGILIRGNITNQLDISGGYLLKMFPYKSFIGITEPVAGFQSNTYQPGTASHLYRIQAEYNVITISVDGQQMAQLMDNTYLSAGNIAILDCGYQINVSSVKMFTI